MYHWFYLTFLFTLIKMWTDLWKMYNFWYEYAFTQTYQCMSSRWSIWPGTLKTWWCPTSSFIALYEPWATGVHSRSSAGDSWTKSVSETHNWHICSKGNVWECTFCLISVILVLFVCPCSGIRLLVWACSGVLGASHGLECSLLEVWGYVQGTACIETHTHTHTHTGFITWFI